MPPLVSCFRKDYDYGDDDLIPYGAWSDLNSFTASVICYITLKNKKNFIKLVYQTY